MTDVRQEPLAQLRAAVKAAGGPVAVARAAGMPYSHLGNILGGKRALGRETAGKLRPHVDVAAEVWVDLLAPLPEAEPSAEAGA